MGFVFTFRKTFSEQFVVSILEGNRVIPDLRGNIDSPMDVLILFGTKNLELKTLAQEH
jgi:hypothetical protein